MTAWDDLRARLDADEPVTLDEIVRIAATAPLPPDLKGATVTVKRKGVRGRPPWTERDVRTVENLCARIGFWSEVVAGRTLNKGEIHERVGLLLCYADPRKGVQTMLARGRQRYGERKGMQIFRDEDFRRVLRTRAAEIDWTNHIRVSPPQK
jgi:hypothetical protein